MRAGAIDLGTNTFNLLIAEKGGDGRLQILHAEEQPVFLGRGGIEKGLLTQEAMTRGMAALSVYRGTANTFKVDHLQGYGTSALRNARNGNEFVSRALNELGIPITVIPGEEEAGLILDGVRQAVTFATKPMLVMDIGGGSIEFILATARSLMWKRSFEIGGTRLLERFTPSDPISIEEQFRIAAHLDAQLDPLFAVLDRHWPSTLVGSAGSFDTLAQMAAHEQSITISATATTFAFDATTFDQIKEGLLSSTQAERMALPAIPEYRVDTLPLALIAIERVLLHGIEEIRWSRYALKEGAAWRMLAH